MKQICRWTMKSFQWQIKFNLLYVCQAGVKNNTFPQALDQSLILPFIHTSQSLTFYSSHLLISRLFILVSCTQVGLQLSFCKSHSYQTVK